MGCSKTEWEKRSRIVSYMSEAGMSNLKQTITRGGWGKMWFQIQPLSAWSLPHLERMETLIPSQRAHTHCWPSSVEYPIWLCSVVLLILYVPHCSWPLSPERCIPWQWWRMKRGSTLKRFWFSRVHLSTHVNWYILTLVHMHLYHRVSSLAGGGMWGDTAHPSGFTEIG